MLPILFQIVIPSGWTWVVAIGIALAIVTFRAVAWRRHARADGKKVTWCEALWSD